MVLYSQVIAVVDMGDTRDADEHTVASMAEGGVAEVAFNSSKSFL